MNVRSVIGSAMAAVALSFLGTGIASADSGVIEADNSDFLVGDTLYFNEFATQCAIHANGDVACDLGQGNKLWGLIPISDIVIDGSFLPAHPTFGLGGQHGNPNARQLWDVPRPPGNVYAGTQFDYAGATCLGGRPHGGGLTCTSHGHTFTLGTQTSIG
ncbi:hypothetical protein ACWDUL_14685 [Nocardia niigatensis]|uniref:hypothetical protein n=1 Tax=Nocardia niigatensis TaxID=209249 RepID=UPI0012F7048C|nr:hypothetical protein [Nocardia niigatensis]